MTNCVYHPEREAVGSCVNCGKLICDECKVVHNEKIYCNVCVDRLLKDTAIKPKAKGLNWFERHLNWTVFLVAVVAPYPIYFVFGLLIGLFLYSIEPYMAEETAVGIAVTIGLIVDLVVLFLVGAWALNKKARSLWNLLWFIVPFGLIVFLCLENRGVQSYETESEQELSEQELGEREERLDKIRERMNMKYPIIVIVLVLVLIGVGVFFGIRLVTMAERINELELNYATLQTSFGNLQQGYNQLETAHNSLQADYDSLESDYDSLESDYYLLKGEFKSLQSDYDDLLAANRDLQALVRDYENVPHSYYSTDAFEPHSNTWEELDHFLTYEFRLPRKYEEGVFDCSESSAYLEWALETAGFDAEIASGPTPSDPTSGYHAWVIVHCEGYRAAIEATALTGKHYLGYLYWNRVPGVVYSKDRFIDHWENYYNGYDETYENIYFAIRDYGATGEWDWWVEFWEF